VWNGHSPIKFAPLFLSCTYRPTTSTMSTRFSRSCRKECGITILALPSKGPGRWPPRYRPSNSRPPDTSAKRSEQDRMRARKLTQATAQEQTPGQRRHSRATASARNRYFESAALTFADTAVMSARPASFGFSTPITLPISCGPAAPVCATAACTSAAISSSDICAGI
jgi:hypothetical protein